jgi:hypothetical protein
MENISVDSIKELHIRMKTSPIIYANIAKLLLEKHGGVVLVALEGAIVTAVDTAGILSVEHGYMVGDIVTSTIQVCYIDSFIFALLISVA